MEQQRKELESEEEVNEVIEKIVQQEIKQDDLIKTKPKFDKRKFFSIVLKGSKIAVLIGLYYAALVMYQLGNFQEAVIIGFAATFFLILNKLESMWG